MKKRIVFCFDGTWNTIDMPYPTNVTKIARAIRRVDRHGVVQIIHYDQGVGTGDRRNWFFRIYGFLAGVFGFGLTENIEEAYRFLVLNYEPGDEIYVFGFSRGAFTARSLVGLIRNSGVISRRSVDKVRDAVQRYLDRKDGDDPDSDEACQFRFENCRRSLVGKDRDWRTAKHPDFDISEIPDLKIAFLGVWDTVGALGLPASLGAIAKLINAKYRFHDVALSPFVERARHAVAADEKRMTFEPSLWENSSGISLNEDPKYKQLAFPGTHTAVGGGGPVRGIQDGTLDWVLRGAREAKLDFDTDETSPIFDLQPDHRARLHNQSKKLGWGAKDWIVGFGLRDRKLGGLRIQDIGELTIRRVQEAETRLPEQHKYEPLSLGHLLTAMRKADTKDKVDVDEALVGIKSLWAEARLRAPDKVIEYKVQPGDTLPKIAEKHLGNGELSELILLHNQNAGLLYRAQELYAGKVIELPVYGEIMVAGDRELAPSP